MSNGGPCVIWEMKLTAHVRRADLAGVDNVEGRARDAVRQVVETKTNRCVQYNAILLSQLERVPEVPEHHGRAENHR